MISRYFVVVLIAGVMVLTACGKKEEPPKPAATPAPPPLVQAPAPVPAPAGVTVSTISLGKAVGADKKVSAPTDTFGKADTIYASIDTTGAGSATLKAKWTYQKDGKVAMVKEETQTITPTGPATSEFHISKPDGWPVGNYEVEVLVGDKPAGTRKFSVK